MKLTKILAMLLALCMILCCFASCDSSDADDDDDDEKVEEKEETEDKDKDGEDDDQLAGKWGMIFDYSYAVAESVLGEKYGGDTALTPLSFVLEWNFTEDGKYSVKAMEFPSEDEAIRFFEILMDFVVQRYTTEEIEDMLDRAEYDTLDEYVEDAAKYNASEFIKSMRDEPEFYEGEYKVEGDVITLITLEDKAEITYNIYKNEMTFEKVKDENGDFDMFEAHALQRQ